MDDDVDTHDEVRGGIPLPRRGPRQRRIIRARDDLYREGTREDTREDEDTDRGAGDTDTGAGRQGWTDVAQRERSAALARTVTARRRDAAEEPPAPPAPRTPDDADAPAVPVPTPPPDDRAPDPAPATTRGTPWRRALVVGLVLIAFAVGLGVGVLLAPAGEAPGGPPPLPSRATLAGDVVGVADGATLTVLVDGRSVDVAVLGLAPQGTGDPARPAPCGADTATAFAREKLLGQRVTLVPEPVGAETDAAGRRSAYVVLGTQQNYTDLALLEGISRWDTSRSFTYGQVFAREEASARTAALGIWGAPCRTAR